MKYLGMLFLGACMMTTLAACGEQEAPKAQEPAAQTTESKPAAQESAAPAAHEASPAEQQSSESSTPSE